MLMMDRAMPRTESFPRGTRVATAKSGSVRFAPWVRSRDFETRLVLNDLPLSLALRTEESDPVLQRRLERLVSKERIVDQLDADGFLLHRHHKRLEVGEVWSLSLGRSANVRLEHGMVMIRDKFSISHFQIVGPETFACCHSRLQPVSSETPLPVHYRKAIAVPNEPVLRMHLLFLNWLPLRNDITVMAVSDGHPRARRKLEVPAQGSRMFSLDEVEPSHAGGGMRQFRVLASLPFDFFTVMLAERDGAPSISIQHVK